MWTAAEPFFPPAGAATAVLPGGTVAATAAGTTRDNIDAFTATEGRPRTCVSFRPQAGGKLPVAQESGSLAHTSGWGCHCTSTVSGASMEADARRDSGTSRKHARKHPSHTWGRRGGAWREALLRAGHPPSGGQRSLRRSLLMAGQAQQSGA